VPRKDKDLAVFKQILEKGLQVNPVDHPTLFGWQVLIGTFSSEVQESWK
jgi:hypothetical protein